jgi:long-chain acyl-CoA synthetase
VTPARPFADIPSLLAALGQRAEAEPEAAALTCYRGRVRTGQLTHRELLQRIAASHRHLAMLGIQRGDRVAVLAPNRLEIPVLYLGALSLGAALVPLNPGAPPDDWSYVIEHAEAKLLITDGELALRLNPLAIPVVRVEEVATPGVGDRGSAGGSDDLAIVLYTSGTTGHPKGVALTQGNVLANGWSMARRFGLGGRPPERDTQLAVLPLFHAHAFGFGLMSALTSGSHLVLAERFDPFAWPEIIQRERVTVTSVVPTLLAPLLESRLDAGKVAGLRCLLVSSAPLAPATARTFEETTGIRLMHGWGLSEYTNFACCLSPALADDQRRALLADGELASIGSPLEDTEVKVIDASGHTLGPEQRGELCVRGPSRMRGYFRDDAATRAAIDAQGWLHTGDEGFFRAGPPPVFFVSGRLKEVIIRGGEKVSPLAVERKIFVHVPELEGRLVVLGFPHATHGEEVGAYVEGPVLDETVRQALIAALDTLSLDLRPKVVLHGTTAIPRTHTGKIQRRKLQPLFARFREVRGPVHIEAI